LKVVICGAGLVGYHIARYLAGAGHEVTVVDQRPELVQKIGESLDIRGLVGHAAHPSTLEQAGAEDADMLIAVTHVDEVNMVACQVAHSLFGVPTKIARVREQDYLKPRWRALFRRSHLPIDVVISPEVEVARAVALRLEVPGSLNVISFVDDKVRLVALRCLAETPIVETPLGGLTTLFPDLHVFVVAIARGERFFLPGPEDMLLAGDEVQIVVDSAHLNRVLPAFGYEVRESERVVIVGGGNIGLYLAQELESRHPALNLKVVERDGERATLVAERLKRAIVLEGDAREREILEEAHVGAAEAVVAVTNNEEVNVMVGLLAKQLGCRRAMVLYNNPNYRRLIEAIDVDVGINPREITVSRILQHVRRGRITSVHTLRDGEAEAFEAEALETSPVVGRPLRDLRLARTVVIGAVVRRGEVLMPRGDTVIAPGDRVVGVARGEAVKRVEQLFAVRADYF